MSEGEMAPQLMARNEFLRRCESSWIVRAAISLPVPLSPMRSTVASVGATRTILSYTSCISGAQLAAARDAGQHGLHALDVHGLGVVVRGAQAQDLDRAFDARVSRDEDRLAVVALGGVLQE